jgi:hypothetical protein
MDIFVVLLNKDNTSDVQKGSFPRYKMDQRNKQDEEKRSRRGRNFPHPSRLDLGPTQPPVEWVPAFFPGVKRPGRGVYNPLPSSAEVKEGVKLYSYSPSGRSWPVLG